MPRCMAQGVKVRTVRFLFSESGQVNSPPLPNSSFLAARTPSLGSNTLSRPRAHASCLG